MLHSRRLDADPGPLTAIVSAPHINDTDRSAAGPRPDPRACIIDALIATVAYRGYDRTTVERVLHSADVAGAVFEEHFQNKEDCLLLAMDELIDEARLRVLTEAAQAEAWPERVRLGLRALLMLLAEDPEAARVWMVESLGAGQAAVERHRNGLDVLTALLEEGRSYAVYPELLQPHIAEALVGGIGSILHRRILEERTHELPGLLAELVYFALMPYLGHHRAMLAGASVRGAALRTAPIWLPV